MRYVWTVVACVASALAFASESAAQVWVGSTGPKAGTVDVGIGGTFNGGYDLPALPASLTVNPGGVSSFNLFETDPSIEPSFGIRGTLGVYISRAFSIEGGFEYARPTLRARVSDDAEGAPDVSVDTSVSRYLITGSALYHFGSNSRVTPFVGGGAGYVRDLYDGNSFVESSWEYHAIGGVKMWFGRTLRAGFRADGGVSVRDIQVDGETRLVPVAAAAFMYRF